jgi:hypothetical protein
MPDNSSPQCHEFQRVIDTRNRQGLTPTQKFTLMVLCSHRLDFKPSIAQLAKATGYTVRCVQKTMNDLVAMGLARAVGTEKCRGGQRQHYQPVVAESANQIPASAESANVVPGKREPDSNPEKESEKKDSGLRPGAATAPPPAPPAEIIPFDPGKKLFDDLVPLLEAAAGGKAGVRAMAAKLMNIVGARDACVIAEQALRMHDPWSWFCGAVNSRTADRNSNGKPRTSANAEILAKIAQARRTGAGML